MRRLPHPLLHWAKRWCVESDPLRATRHTQNELQLKGVEEETKAEDEESAGEPDCSNQLNVSELQEIPPGY